jgi:hypothetical protein
VHDLEKRLSAAIPTTVGITTRLAYQRAQAAGIALEPLLATAGLTKQEVEDVDARLSVQCQIRFLTVAASALQDEFLGFHLGQVAELRLFGFPFYVALSSDTLGEALRRLSRYISITNESVSVKYLGGKDIRMVTNYVGVPRHLDLHQIEFWVVALLRLTRTATDCLVKPRRVRFTHRRGDNFSEFAAFLGCDIEFGAALDEVVFATSIDDMPVVSADSYLNKLLIANCEEALSRHRMKRGQFRSIVENAIAPVLPHGNAHASEIASRCGLSQRTFARRWSRRSQATLRPQPQHRSCPAWPPIPGITSCLEPPQPLLVTGILGELG